MFATVSNKHSTARLALVCGLFITVSASSGCNAVIDIIFPPRPPVVIPPPQPLPTPPRTNPQVDAGPDVPPNNTQPDPCANGGCNFPGFKAVLRLGNTTNQPLIVRVRPLKPSVVVNCETLIAKPELTVTKALFAPAKVWQVNAGRAIALHNMGRPGCQALLIDGSGLARRLVVWKGLNVVSQPSTTGGGHQDRLVGIAASEDGMQWPDSQWVHPAPIEVSPPQPAKCAQPDAGIGVDWTTPLPVGDVTLVDMAEAPDGCRLLDLFADSGLVTWVFCTPPGSFPFEVGDSFFINPLKHGHDLSPIAGVELLGAGVRLRVGRGTETVYFGKGDAKITPIAGCGLSMAECGGRQQSLKVEVTAGGKASVVQAGTKIKLGTGRVLHVLRARDLPVHDKACGLAGMEQGRQVESAYVEVTP